MLPCIETPRLILGKADYEDWADLYHNIWSDAGSAQYMLWRVTSSEEEARQRMLRTLDFQASHEAYTVYERRSGAAIGFAGIMEIKPDVWEDIGIAVGPRFTGKGYGPEILSALTNHCFALGGRRMIATCRSENAPSRKMILRCGFTFDHTENRTDPRSDEPYVLEFYRKERDEK